MMKLKIKLILLLVLSIGIRSTSSAHSDHQHSKIGLHQWSVDDHIIQGSFLFGRNDSIFIEQNNHSIIGIPFKKFSSKDQIYFQNKILGIQELNQELDSPKTKSHFHISKSRIFIARVVIPMTIFFALLLLIKQKKSKRLIVVTCILGSGSMLLSFTDPNIIRNAFLSFAPNVNTFWDANYFYVESKGIPTTHEMMVGISDHGWQQQVPIPQCYIGSNAWSIPLNPIMATNPTPVDQLHFTRGAIAIAVNGVPIFNPHTNTGVDAYLDGQLDNFGGHCGRGDDYHYHTAPLHLYEQTTFNLPIAYAFDGFAVYGNLEPDGVNMVVLDDNHGHYYNGEYHYHGTTDSPYMIAKFAGVVTEDSTHQLIPQAQAHPVRNENWTPLNGALITSCTPNISNNGYNLEYTLNGVTGYATEYSWNGTDYLFQYLTPSGTNSVHYNGFLQCDVPMIVDEKYRDPTLLLYPNPFHHKIWTSNNSIYISMYNSAGEIIYRGANIALQDFSNLPKGLYFIKANVNGMLFKMVKE
jgi:hypothetical protein